MSAGADALFATDCLGAIDPVHLVGHLQQRRRPEEHAIDEREHRRVGADPERERQDDGGREGGLRAEAAKRVAQVLEEGVKHTR